MNIKAMVMVAAGALVAGKAAEVAYNNYNPDAAEQTAQSEPAVTETAPLILQTAAKEATLEGDAVNDMAGPIGYETEVPTELHDVYPELLTALAAEQEALKNRTARLEAREANLELSKIAIQEQIQHLETLEKRIKDLVGSSETQQNEDITRLVRMYSAMKPNQAGAIMDEMDIEVTVMVLAAMQESVSGPILANMRPVRAQAVSKIIFERSRLPGNQNLVNVKLN